jgi:hypothetical protein
MVKLGYAGEWYDRPPYSLYSTPMVKLGYGGEWYDRPPYSLYSTPMVKLVYGGEWYDRLRRQSPKGVKIGLNIIF